VCKWELFVPGNFILSVDWSSLEPMKLCCSMKDGSISVWSLLSHGLCNVEAIESNSAINVVTEQDAQNTLNSAGSSSNGNSGKSKNL
jgi:hypothetical protein